MKTLMQERTLMQKRTLMQERKQFIEINRDNEEALNLSKKTKTKKIKSEKFWHREKSWN